MTEQAKISEAELLIMQVLWAQGEVSSQQIVALLQSKKDWAATTIKTLLQRLVKKGFIKANCEQKPYTYYACISEQETLVSMTENLLLHVCSRKMGKTLAQLIETTPLTHEDVTLLARVIAEKQTQAVDILACNCVVGLCQCPEHQHCTSKN